MNINLVLGQMYYISNSLIILLTGFFIILLLVIISYVRIRKEKQKEKQFKRLTEILPPFINADLEEWQSITKSIKESMSHHTKKQNTVLTSSPQSLITQPIDILNDKQTLSKIKYIGYEPINIFAQTEPLNYPYVVMPSRPKCPIKFPQKGRSGRKGYKEEAFLLYIQKYFKDTFRIYDDRYVLTKANRYEPDFSLLNENNEVNIFLDIEIDEPYEGINDINNRKVTHFQLSDVNRNNEFKNRGWIVVRFAEIQIHLNPNGCCRFIADVIKSIYPQFTIPQELMSVKHIEPVQQWTKETALDWSRQKYREKYLGISQFGYIPETLGTDITIIQDWKVEEQVIDDKIDPIQETDKRPVSEQNLVSTAIQSDKYISFQYDQKRTIVKPLNVDGRIMTGYCYLKNSVREFETEQMKNICLKDNYCTLSLPADKLGIKRVANIMNIIIPNKKYVRMEYTRREWNSFYQDPITGELINKKTEAETSIRTISDIQLDTEGWGENYIRAYCHKREEGRTFYFARISLLEILDI